MWLHRYPSTVATLSRRVRDVIEAAFERTSEGGRHSALLGARLQDFGFRGCTSVEQSILGGSAHLLSFTGSDTMSAAYYAQVRLRGGVGRPPGASHTHTHTHTAVCAGAAAGVVGGHQGHQTHTHRSTKTHSLPTHSMHTHTHTRGLQRHTACRHTAKHTRTREVCEDTLLAHTQQHLPCNSRKHSVTLDCCLAATAPHSQARSRNYAMCQCAGAYCCAVLCNKCSLR